MRRVLASTALVLLACGGRPSEPPVADHSSGITTTNAILSNAILSNAILSNAILSNAILSNAILSNAILSNAILSNALTSEVLRPDGATEGELARKFLAYVYSCALPADASLPLVIGGHDYGTLRGGIGLAPEWGEPGGSCDEHCQRLVSACLLARTNFWGVPVQISLRGPSPQLTPTEAERAEFPLREGAYFGNLFVSGGTRHLYACAGPGSNLPQLTRRFCSGGTGVCAIRVLFDCVNPGPPRVRTASDTLNARFACLRQDPNDGAVRDCYSGGVSIYGDDPQGRRFPDVITVYLREPVTVCGDGVCAAAETHETCPVDCSAGWARSIGGVRTFPVAMGPVPGGDLLVGVLAGDTADLGGGPMKILPGEQAFLLGRVGPDGLTHRWSTEVAVSDSVAGYPGPATIDATGAAYLTLGYSGDIWIGRERIPFVGGVDFSNGAVIKVAADGSIVWRRTWPSLPFGVLADPAGQPHVIFDEYRPDGSILAVVEALEPSDGTTRARFELPTEPFLAPVVLDGTGRLLVAGGFPELATASWIDLETGAATPAEVPPDASSIGPAVVAPDGSVVAVVMRTSNEQGWRPLLVRYGLDGHIAWQKALGVPGALAGGPPIPLEMTVLALVVSPATGRIAVLGDFSSPFDMENDVLVPTGYLLGANSPDVFVALYEADGRKVWTRQLGSGGYDLGGSVSFDASDSVLVSGAYSQTGLFDGRILDNPYGGGTTTSFRTFIVSLPPR